MSQNDPTLEVVKNTNVLSAEGLEEIKQGLPFRILMMYSQQREKDMDQKLGIKSFDFEEYKAYFLNFYPDLSESDFQTLYDGFIGPFEGYLRKNIWDNENIDEAALRIFLREKGIGLDGFTEFVNQLQRLNSAGRFVRTDTLESEDNPLKTAA